MTRISIDIERVADRLRPLVADAFVGAQSLSLTQMPTGMSSLTYAVDFVTDRPQRIVVKMAPPGLEPVRNRDVLRQARVLRYLADFAEDGVGVPGVLFEDAGAPPEVPPLFGMTFVDGECFEPLADEGDPPPHHVVADRAQAAAAMLAVLHGVSVDASALRAVGSVVLADEVARWARVFESVDADLRPNIAQECGRALLDDMPQAGEPVLLHGDYRLGNIIFDGTLPTAIIDWEIWSRGDARLDLAWLLLNSDPTRPSTVRSDVGLPSLDALVATYENALGAGVDRLPWFMALVRYKQAAALAFIVKNSRRSDRPDLDKERRAIFIEQSVASALAELGR